MTYTFEPLDVQAKECTRLFDIERRMTIYQTPAWLEFLSRTQNGDPVFAALKEGSRTIGHFVGMIVRRWGFRILGSPFPGWSTAYMGLALDSEVSRGRAVQALIELAFQTLDCSHLEVMDRNLTVDDLNGLDVQYRLYRGFQVDLTRDEDDLIADMTSACRRCIRKADKSGVVIEVAGDPAFANEYFAQLQDVFAKQGLVPTYGVERVRLLIEEVYPTGHLLLLRALDPQGKCIATGIFPHANGVMYFWGGASWRASQHLRPNEALQWAAMRIAKRMGMRTFDMGGGGEYKRKYGGAEIEVPWFRKSKYPLIARLRNVARNASAIHQWVSGHLRSSHDSIGFSMRRSWTTSCSHRNVL